MNESFASTTLRDATFIGERILAQMTELGLLGLYVTFLDELATSTPACVSMVGTVNPDDPAERTYKIVRRPADRLRLRSRHRAQVPAYLPAAEGAHCPCLRRHSVKVHLMYADRDFAPDAALPVNEPDLAADLELGPLLDAMAGGDKFLFESPGRACTPVSPTRRRSSTGGTCWPTASRTRAWSVTCTTSRSRRSTPTGTCSASCSVTRQTRS